MTNVVIISENDLTQVNGSTVRPKWEFKALKKIGFEDVKLIDKFDQSMVKNVKNSLIHAQQLSGRFLEGCKYMVDIHGLEHIQSTNLSNGFPIYSWKKYAYKAKATYYKKLEIKMFKNACHLICSSEDIQEKVSKYQNSTLIRNAIFLDEFHSTTNTELKIALVGPFIPGTINFDGLQIIKKVIKNLPEIQFEFIGKTAPEFKNELKFENVKFLGVVENYAESLASNNVLFAPYPKHAKYLGSKNKFLEAAASRMPIVTTSSGAVDFRNDLLLINDNTDKICELIIMLKNENTRKELGNKLRKEIEEKYNADIETEKLIRLYNEYSN